MSRHYDAYKNETVIIDKIECRNLYDEIWCVNCDCPHYMDTVTEDGYCLSNEKCMYYEPEPETAG